MAVVIALDAGTTGVRAFAVDPNGRAVGYRYREFTQHFPRPGWVEHDATEIWHAIVGTTAELIASLQEPVAAIGITDQRETVVAWDRRTGLPRHRAIVWQDRRTAARCDALAAAGHLPLVREATGPGARPVLLRLEGVVAARRGRGRGDEHLAIGTIDSWLLWNLTGGRSTPPSPRTPAARCCSTSAPSTGPPSCATCSGCPPTPSPRCGPRAVGSVSPTRHPACPPGIPISGIAGDQQAALFGQACFAPGDTKNTYGTGSFVLMNVGPGVSGPVDGLLTTVAWTIPDGTGGTRTDYAFEGAIFSTGSAVQWLRDGLGADRLSRGGRPARGLGRPSTDDVFFVPAFTGLGSPWWDPYARAPSLGSPAAPPGPTWHAPWWSRWPCRPATWSTR
jgi:glycerol kinase